MREKTLYDDHSDQPYQGGDSQVVPILKDKEKNLGIHR